MPITPVTLFLDVEQGKVPKSGTTFGLTMKQGEIPYIADSALQINRSISAQSVAGRVTFSNVIPSDDLIALGFTDARYTIESAAIGLSVDFLVPRSTDPDFSGGDLSVLMALSVPEGEGAAPIGTVRGWTPLIANIADGARVVQRVVDWVGGLGDKPATGLYVGATGLVAAIGSAVDIRGATGAQGPAGAGSGTSISNGPGSIAITPEGIAEVQASTRIKEGATAFPTTGRSLEIYYFIGGNGAFLISYDRTAGVYTKFQIDGSEITLNATGTISLVTALARLRQPSTAGTVRDTVSLGAALTNSSDASFTAQGQLKASKDAVMVTRIAFDEGAGANTTGLLLFDVNSGTMQRVNVGAANSGGDGQRLLTIAN